MYLSVSLSKGKALLSFLTVSKIIRISPMNHESNYDLVTDEGIKCPERDPPWPNTQERAVVPVEWRCSPHPLTLLCAGEWPRIQRTSGHVTLLRPSRDLDQQSIIALVDKHHLSVRNHRHTRWQRWRKGSSGMIRLFSLFSDLTEYKNTGFWGTDWRRRQMIIFECSTD